MFDVEAGGTRLERARGRAAIALRDDRLTDLRQSGSAKVMLPRTYSSQTEAVFLNTAGGLTGGDVLDFEMDVSDGAAVGTTQTAERAYRSGDKTARVSVHLNVGAGGKLAWLPQETILYDGAALDRDTSAELAGDAELLLLDMLVFGRVAMGETLSALRLRDRRSVWREGRPVLLDPLWISHADLTRSGPAGLSGARAVAALHLIARDAEDRLPRLRSVLPGDGSIAASAWDGRLSLRAMHRDPAKLRAALARAIPCLTGQPLPRVWPH